jgi:hypothetical protein
MKTLLLACAVATSLLTIAPAQANTAQGTTAQAPTYEGDWRMTIHAEEDGVDCGIETTGFPCRVVFDIRTNQPGWEGSDMYDVSATIDGKSIYADAGQTYYSDYDPAFYGVRAIAEKSSLSAGVHVLVLDWLYRGVWMCGPEVPNGCSYVGREHVRKIYKFRWHADGDQVVRPFVLPSSKVSINANRQGRSVKVTGVVKARRLNADFEPTTKYLPTRGARVVLQTFSPKRRTWIDRATVTSNRKGNIAATVNEPKVTRWRWLLKPTKAYAGSTSLGATE